jgi:hypothetical protein
VAGRSLLHRIHNPRNRHCGCAPDCWCRRTTIGRAVKWWFPARLFGIHHKSSFFDTTTEAERREWKRQWAMQDGVHEKMGRTEQPRYERIVKLGPMRFGITVRQPDGTIAIHEILGGPRLDTKY